MAAPNGRGHRLTRRGPHSRGARESSLYSVRSASVSASWLGSLAAFSAATRTRAPKRATVNQKAAPSRGDFLRGSILTNATVHRTVAPGFDAPLGRAKAGVRFAPLFHSGRRGKRRSAACGGCSKPLSRQCPVWRTRMWPPDGWRNEGTAEEHAKKITTRLGGDFWSGRRGSNSLPRPWQGRALPDELRPQTQD